MQSARTPSSSPDRRPGRLSPVLLVLAGACIGIEMILMASDVGLIGTRLWRGLAYQNGAFWAGLLHDWRPNYAAQPWLMFFTYAFLHSGFWHLAGNMMTLFFLGVGVEDRAGRFGLAMIYAASVIGGGVGFGLLSGSPQPMVGASGALFGLAGAWLFWQWSDRRREGRRLWPVWRMVLGLVLLNAVMWVAMNGLLAWETHLGGFVFGWGAAAGLERWHEFRARR